MRIKYTEDEMFGGQSAMFQANCRRSLKGKKGQAALRELEAALMALPEKRLIHGLLADDKGGVCAIACYAQHEGLDLSKFDPEGDSDEVGIEAGMPPLAAWKVVEMNDVTLDHVTPEERYTAVLKWVREQLGSQ